MNKIHQLINSSMQHAIEHVERPGGSHEGVGRKKRTRPVRAVYNPDGKHTYVGLGVRGQQRMQTILVRRMGGSALGASYGRLLLFGTSHARNVCLSVASQGRMLSPG